MARHPADKAEGEQWDPSAVRALRAGLGDSQQAFADRLGTRQQTVSEWERGASRPRRMAQRLLTMLAEEAGTYSTRRDEAEREA
jgi:DNA-binding transcriptional regulator YiaG